MKELIKKEQNQIVAFYILYFGWLFTLTTLTVDPRLQDYFAVFVVLFYFIFLRDFWDPLFFLAFAIAGLINRIFYLDPNWNFNFSPEQFMQIPIWLPLSWGTTAVALKKFFVLVNRKVNN